MEEDVATNSSYIPGDSNLVLKEEENGMMKSEEKTSDSFAPSQYQTLSRILSINPLKKYGSAQLEGLDLELVSQSPKPSTH